MSARPGTERLVTERLVLRPVAASDAPALHGAYRDPVVMRWWSSGPHASLDETRAYLVPRAGERDWREWAITLHGNVADGDTAIGTLAAHLRRPGVAEIGYLLRREHWGRGYAREAVAALLRQLFAAEGYRRVMADADPDNAASIRVLEALGFRREGLLRAEWETHLGVRDSLILGLLADEWRAANLSDR